MYIAPLYIHPIPLYIYPIYLSCHVCISVCLSILPVYIPLHGRQSCQCIYVKVYLSILPVLEPLYGRQFGGTCKKGRGDVCEDLFLHGSEHPNHSSR